MKIARHRKRFRDSGRWLARARAHYIGLILWPAMKRRRSEASRAILLQWSVRRMKEGGLYSRNTVFWDIAARLSRRFGDAEENPQLWHRIFRLAVKEQRKARLAVGVAI